MMRQLYRTIIPLRVRELGWRVYNLFSYAKSERMPVAPVLDYDAYWQWRIDHNATAMAHPELVRICGDLLDAGASILDIGCGSGEFLAALCAQKGITGIGIDTSERAVRIARARGVDARVADISVAAIEPWKPIQLVTVFEVIEHLPNPEQVLLNLKQLRCPIMVSIPNTGHVSARLRLGLGRFPRQWVYHPGEHLRFWTLRDFQLMAEYLGYAMDRVIPLKGETPLNRWVPSLFAEYLVFVLVPK